MQGRRNPTLCHLKGLAKCPTDGWQNDTVEFDVMSTRGKGVWSDFYSPHGWGREGACPGVTGVARHTMPALDRRPHSLGGAPRTLGRAVSGLQAQADGDAGARGGVGRDRAFCGWRGLKPTRRGRRSARGPPPRRGAARGPADVPGRQAARLVGSSSWPPPGRAPPSWTSPSSLLAEECDPVTPHRPANSEVQRQVRTISVIFLPLGYMLIQVDFFFKKLPSRALKINRIFR